MKSRYSSPLLPQAEALSQRTSGADNFIDLTGDECAGSVTGANNVVDLTDSMDNSDLPHSATKKVHHTKSVEYRQKRKRKRVVTSGCKDVAVSTESTAEVLETANQTDQSNNTLKIMDRIIFKLGRRSGYTNFMIYTMIGQSAKEYNATAYIPSSQLRPPPHIVPPPGLTVHQAIMANAIDGVPAYPDPNLEVPALPTTLKGIKTLTKANLTAVENYYGLSHDGDVAEGRDRIKQAYGVTLGT